MSTSCRDLGKTRVMTLEALVAAAGGRPLGREMWIYEGTLTHAIRDIYPVSFDALMVMAVHSGNAEIGIDVCRYRVGPDSMGILRPGRCLTAFEPEDGQPPQVTVIGCSEKVEDSIAHTLDDLLPLVIKAHMDPVVRLRPGGVSALKPYFDLLRTMVNGDAEAYNVSRKAGCIFKAALYEMIDRRVPDSLAAVSGRNLEITAGFLHLLGENFHTRREVEYYASRLSITPKHLSAVLKSSFGYTAGDWIDAYVMREAKILLSHTSLRIKEIASRLNFASQASFGKFFRQSAGMSPSDYRRVTPPSALCPPQDTTPLL